MAISVSSFHPTFLPHTIFDSQELTGRHLLQAKKGPLYQHGLVQVVTGLGSHPKVSSSNLGCGKNSVGRGEPHGLAKPKTRGQPGCSVNFEFLNYTTITSKCKGPRYPPKVCCGAFKDFACPYADVLNDLTNDCASTMFSYINLYGNYPPGLFASECREGKQGLACPALPPSVSADDTANQNHT